MNLNTTATYDWLGCRFSIFQPRGSWNDVPGIYIFAAEWPDGTWQPLYIGKAESFRDRFAYHERWAEALRYGATHVHAVVVKTDSERALLEKYLIRNLNPLLNTQFRSA